MIFDHTGPVPEIGDRVFYTARVGVQAFASGGMHGEVASFGPAIVTGVNPGATVDLFVMFRDKSFPVHEAKFSEVVAGAEQSRGCWSVDHVRW